MDRFGGPFPVFGGGYAVGVCRVALLVIVLASACSVQTASSEGAPVRTSSTTTSTMTTPSTSLAAADGSTAVILIGPARYDLDAVCAAGGAGEVEVSLAGRDVNGEPVVGYVRAFLGEPYVSLLVGEGDEAVLFEPRLEGVLPFELTDRGVQFPEVDFVSELDLESGEFEPAGLGSVEVDCRSYARELPPVSVGSR
jgi:hypothetical protein